MISALTEKEPDATVHVDARNMHFPYLFSWTRNAHTIIAKNTNGKNTLQQVATNGSIGQALLLHHQGDNAFEQAARYGRIEQAVLMHHQGDNAFGNAARNGSIGQVLLLHYQGDYAFGGSAWNGSINQLLTLKTGTNLLRNANTENIKQHLKGNKAKKALRAVGITDTEKFVDQIENKDTQEVIRLANLLYSIYQTNAKKQGWETTENV